MYRPLSPLLSPPPAKALDMTAFGLAAAAAMAASFCRCSLTHSLRARREELVACDSGMVKGGQGEARGGQGEGQGRPGGQG